MQEILHLPKKYKPCLRSMALKWTRSALRNLEDIAEYIAKDSPLTATRFAAELKEKTGKLVAHPGMGRAGRVPGSRELVIHKNYLAIYRVRENCVEILRIHHVAKLL